MRVAPLTNSSPIRSIENIQRRMDNHRPNHYGPFEAPAPVRRNSANSGHEHHGGHFPRMTGYRILTIVLTAGFGLSKAKLSYEGYSTAPNTLDWLYGVVVFLILYWLGIYERHAMHYMPWMFEIDYVALLWRFITGKNRSSHRVMRYD